MRVLYVAMADDYGDPARGKSFEEANLRGSLDGMDVELVAFDFVAEAREHGNRAMNRRLVERAAEVEPDVSFFLLFEDEIRPETIEQVSAKGGGPTVNWFADDHWRFERFTKRYVPAFDWATTTDRESLPKYRQIGCENVILTQWACNRYDYDKTANSLEYDVTFIGQPYGERPDTIELLRAAGFEVECWGHGWPNGRLGQDEMVRVFGASRLNLNLSSAYQPPRGIRTRLSELVRRTSPAPRKSQIKGRTFEVPGSGGFLLTDRQPYLEEYLEPERDVGVFDGPEDLVDRVGWWLEHEPERAAVAESGYRRVRAEHTYDHRLAEIFLRMGVPGAAALQPAAAQGGN